MERKAFVMCGLLVISAAALLGPTGCTRKPTGFIVQNVPDSEMEDVSTDGGSAPYNPMIDLFEVTSSDDDTSDNAHVDEPDVLFGSASSPIVHISAGDDAAAAVCADGTVIGVGEGFSTGWNDVSGWTSISDVVVSSTGGDPMGVMTDGTVMPKRLKNVDGVTRDGTNAWKDIVSVASGRYLMLGLTSDGTLLVHYLNGTVDGKTYEEISGFDFTGWTDITEIDLDGNEFVLGVKRDGTVLLTAMYPDDMYDVSGWTDIVSAALGWNHAVGIKSDGTVVAAGTDDNGALQVDNWTDIVAVSAGYGFTAGLRSDGTVVTAGLNDRGQCNVSGWTDITEISAGGDFLLGLRSDGTVLFTGNKDSLA